MEYETVIGLEVHVQLSTDSKIFGWASAEFGADPNFNVDQLCFGMPGALPVLNKRVVDDAIKMGLAMNCEIRRYNRFARKHYFYPDLPKGYQISQFDEPICERGNVVIRFDGTERTIGITRIHMEEDAGKNIHDMRTQASLVDLNRAGVPLLEIVSEPDIRTPAEANAYLRTIRQLVRYLEVGDGNMEEGSLRCDANISLRPKGEMKFGTRTEIKNMNSFKFVQQALEYEVARQMKILKGGGEIKQQTLLFDSGRGVTIPMRGKEESADYRYFPDPDLPPVEISESWIQEIKTKMPKLPEESYQDMIKVFNLSEYDAGVLTAERAYADYFAEVYEVCNNAKLTSNWLTSELFGALKKSGIDFKDNPISSKDLGALVLLIDSKAISGKMAKTVFEEMFATGKDPQTIVDEKGLKQITDPNQISEIVEKIFAANPTQLQDYLSGNEKLHGFFVGQVMKETGGSANPSLVNKVIKESLGKLKE
ncbi:MAG: Asp-tRNA(Asn)/Glu-tRNA(Gln) amidotransferase subunit GatB [Bdellovibrionota bacterium]